MAMYESLTVEERAYVDAYLQTMDSYRAVQLMMPKAKPGTHKYQAKKYRKCDRVRAAIDERITARGTWQDRGRRLVMQTLCHLLEADIADAYDGEGKLLALGDMPDAVRASILEFTSNAYNYGTGVKIKLTGKTAVVKLAAEILGMYREIDPDKKEREDVENAGAALASRIDELSAKLRKGGVAGVPGPFPTEGPVVPMELLG